MEASGLPHSSWRFRVHRAALVLWGGLVVLWGFDVATELDTGAGAVRLVAQALALAAASLGLAIAVLAVRRLTRSPHGKLLLGMLAVALGAAFLGLDHEVGRGYYTDEGHYLHHARRIHHGEIFTRTFVYPHLLYYLDAFALWLAHLFPWVVDLLARGVWGVRSPDAQDWLVLRWVQASLGASTVVPVFVVARRLAGPLAGCLAGGLVVGAAPYHFGFQVNICDVPSAVFAAWCLFWVARLLDDERPADYLAAGVMSGLAAAAKYPAGLVAVAIVAVWLRHRLRTRRWGMGLVLAGGASLGAFLIVHFSLLRHIDGFLGPRGIAFGANQYVKGGWTGVTPPSNALYYLEVAQRCFGWPALVLGLVGLGSLTPSVRRRVGWLLPFPVVFLGFITSMSMVVIRNFFPAVPALAIVLGIGVAGLMERVSAWRVARVVPRRFAAVLFGVAVLATPLWTTGVQVVALTQPSTRDMMSAWVRRNLPRGTGILKESYTPNFPPGAYFTREQRFAFRFPKERFEDPRFEYLLLAGTAYGRFFNTENQRLERAAWYEDVFASYELVHQADPALLRLGPELRLYRLRSPSAAQ